MKLSLKERLVKWMLRQHTSFVPSGEIQRLVARETSYTPRTVVRRLEELVNEGRLEVKYVKGHAHYRAKPILQYEPQVDSWKKIMADNQEMIKWFDNYPVKV